MGAAVHCRVRARSACEWDAPEGISVAPEGIVVDDSPCL